MAFAQGIRMNDYEPIDVKTGGIRLPMTTERRTTTRINERIPLIVRGAPGRGTSYQFTSLAENIGAGGLLAHAPRIMEVGEKLTLFVRFALAGSNPPQAPAIAARAVVIRVEEKSGESCNFAAAFVRHRFI